MTFFRNPWMRRLALTVLVLYWLALCTGTHLPGNGMGPALINDKLLHFSGYLGLALLLCVAVATRRKLTWRVLLLIYLLIIGYGMMDELFQLPVPGRSADVRDWFADCAGAALGVAIAGGAHAYRQSKKQKSV